MPFEGMGNAAALITSQAKAARGKLRAGKAKPKPPQYENSAHFSRCPLIGALMRHPGRDKRGQVRWVLSAAELRYLVTAGGYANQDGFCKASQGQIARDLGIGRRFASKLEAGIVAKGLALSIPISRQRGRWGYRLLRLIYPAKPRRESEGAQTSDGSYLPSPKLPELPSEPLMPN